MRPVWLTVVSLTLTLTLTLTLSNVCMACALDCTEEPLTPCGRPGGR